MEYQILTPSGFKDFDAIHRHWHNEAVHITFTDGSSIKTARLHRFIVDGKEVFAQDVHVGMVLSGQHIVESVSVNTDPQYFYDPINVDGGEIYLHDDGLVSHNSFIGSGDTLISPQKLLELKAQTPLFEQDNVKVYEKPMPEHEYMMFVDVAKGRGQDYSTFTVIDVSVKPFKQVATYRDNNISPLLFPDIIYKYANTFNQAWIVVESNNSGEVVCNALYYDLEYENVFVESVVKANSIGVNMNKKVKRIGCSNIKDLVEQNKLEVVDAETIIEMSTFVAKGQSYEASDDNHDDLMMNLVLFGWFTTTSFFSDMTDVNIRNMLYEERMKQIEDDLPPFGIIDDGLNDETEVIDGEVWTITPTNLF